MVILHQLLSVLDVILTSKCLHYATIRKIQHTTHVLWYDLLYFIIYVQKNLLVKYIRFFKIWFDRFDNWTNDFVL